MRTAHDLREYAGQVFRFGVPTARGTANPAAELSGALVAFVERNMGAVLEPAATGELLRAIDSYCGQPVTRDALQLCALVFHRIHGGGSSLKDSSNALRETATRFVRFRTFRPDESDLAELVL